MSEAYRLSKVTFPGHFFTNACPMIHEVTLKLTREPPRTSIRPDYRDRRSKKSHLVHARAMVHAFSEVISFTRTLFIMAGDLSTYITQQPSRDEPTKHS